MVKGADVLGDIRVGDRVVVPLGLTEVEAVVLRVSESRPRPLVTVSLDLDELDEPFITSYPRDVVRLAA